MRKHRHEARHVQKLKIFENANDVRRLDKHVDEFERAISNDLKQHDAKKLRKHADEFEHEIHDELGLLIKQTRDDLKLYNKVFRKLQKFRKRMEKLENSSYSSIAGHELKYADLITKSMNHKLDALERLFKRCRRLK